METLLAVLAMILLPVPEGELGANAVALGDVRTEHVIPAVHAAVRHATPRVSAPLIVAIIWGESRFVPDQRTGKVCGVRCSTARAATRRLTARAPKRGGRRGCSRGRGGLLHGTGLKPREHEHRVGGAGGATERHALVRSALILDGAT
jgi:hypothetical protein